VYAYLKQHVQRQQIPRGSTLSCQCMPTLSSRNLKLLVYAYLKERY